MPQLTPTPLSALPGALPRAARLARPPVQEDDPGFWESLGRTALSGIGAVGNAFDLPGSMIRDLASTLSGRPANPFDQLLSPFSHENRTTGRDLLERGGLLRSNQAGLDWGDVGGFLGEVALDPLTFLTGPSRALTAGGRVAQRAGLLGNVAKAAPGVGRRVGRMRSTLDDLLSASGPDAVQRATDAAQAMGLSLDDLRGERLGGLLGLGLPFRDPSFVLGRAGGVGEKVARGLDRAGDILRYGRIPGTDFSPGQHAARIFSARAKGTHTPEISREFAEPLFDEQEAIIRGVRADTARKVSELASRGALDDEASMLGRMYAEGVLTPEAMARLTPEQAAKAEAVGETLQSYTTPAGKGESFPELLESMQAMGSRVDKFSDPAGILHFPREFIELIANRAHNLPREDYLRGLKEGTEHFRRVISDPKFLEGSLNDAVDHFWDRYGDEFTTLFPEPAASRTHQAIRADDLGRKGFVSDTQRGGIRGEAQEQAARDRRNLVRELVHRIRKVYTPEQRAAGGFGRNVLLDAQDAQIGMRLKRSRESAGLEAIRAYAKPLDEWDNLNEPARLVKDVLNDMGLDEITSVRATVGLSQNETKRAGALVTLAERMGLGFDDASLDTVRNMAVPERLAEDMTRLVKGDDIKQVVGPVMRIADAATNLFKVGVLSWPARHVRDLVSGTAMSILTGHYKGKVARQVHRMLAGETADFTHIPVIQRMLRDQGLPVTPENSTEMMRQLAYTHELHSAVSGPRGIAEVAGDTPEMLPGRTEEMMGEFAGRDPLNPLQPSTLMAGSSANPFRIRGVGQQSRTEFVPAAISERVGRYTDTMNRLTPFIVNLERGAAPEQAAALAKALQVNYSPRSFTAAERKYLKRLFPFYSFSSRMLPTVFRELAARPGGGIAQAIRAQRIASQDPGVPVPDYVAESAAIPLGEDEEGNQEFVTGLGLMHEQPLSFFGGGLRGAGLEAVSQANPLVKGPLEWITGESFFQRTPMGGRELLDMDPTIGRTIANVSDRITGEKTERAEPFIGRGFEAVVANSPLSRLATTLRTLTDPRKSAVDLGLNLGTGIRVSDVSPASQDAILRDRASAIAREMGASEFSNVYFPQAVIEQTVEDNPELAAQMAQFNALRNALARRARLRKRERLLAAQ